MNNGVRTESVCSRVEKKKNEILISENVHESDNSSYVNKVLGWRAK